MNNLKRLYIFSTSIMIISIITSLFLKDFRILQSGIITISILCIIYIVTNIITHLIIKQKRGKQE